MSECNTPQSNKRRPLWRFILFLASLAVGIAVGAIGYYFTGNQTWFVAIPGVLALVWLFVANPQECCGIDAHCSQDDTSRQ
jgi:uncharacterized membrane protein YoaK (UPF0700 family)